MSKRHQQPCITWTDKLALRPNDLSPSEYETFQKHLTTCPACAKAFADYQALHTRLRTLPRPATQSTPLRWPELFLGEEAEKPKRGNHMNHPVEKQEEDTEKAASPEPLTFPTLPPRRSPQQHLRMLAAVLMVALLVGTSTILFVRLRIGNGTESPTIPLRDSWKQVALYSGTGSKTITIQNVQLPIVWGDAYSCLGGGSLQIKATTVSGDGHRGNIDAGTDHCPFVADLAPLSASLEPVPQFVQTIAVTAPASTSWTFQLSAEISQPVFPLNSAWISQIGLGGQSSSEGEILPAETVNGQVLQPKQWAVAIVCFGTGRGSVTLTPNGGKIAFPVCDGQIGLHILTYPQAIQVRTVYVESSGNLLWSMNLLVCGNTNGSMCS